MVRLLRRGEEAAPPPAEEFEPFDPAEEYNEQPEAPVYRVALPRWFLALHLGFMVYTAATFALVAVVAGFMFLPTVLYPLSIGPFAPWITVGTWLWNNGLVSVPLALCVTGMFAVSDLRRRALRIIGIAVFWTGMATVGAAALALLVWVAGFLLR